MNKRDYNPLNEGYSGLKDKFEGYQGKEINSDGTTNTQLAPKKFPKIKSGITKSNQSYTSQPTKSSDAENDG